MEQTGVLVTAVASQAELKALTPGLSVLSTHSEQQCLLLSCRIHNREIVLVRTGVGPAKAAAGAQHIAHRGTPDAVLLLGAAGALDPHLRVGDIIIAHTVLNMSGEQVKPHPSLSKKIYDCLCAAGLPVQWGSALGASRFIYKKKEKASIYSSRGAVCVDMESMPFVRFFSSKDIPVCDVRVISDTAHRDIIDIGSLIRTKNRSGIPGVARYLLRHPSEILKGAQLMRDLGSVKRRMNRAFHTIVQTALPAS